MAWYSDLPAPRNRQIAADALIVVWTAGSVVLGLAVHHAIAALSDTARQVETAGAGISTGLRDTGDQLAQVPLLGSRVSDPFIRLGDAAAPLEGAGADLAVSLERLAVVAAVVVGLLVLLLVAVPWARSRFAFLTTARTVRALAADEGARPLLALRALTTLDPSTLATVGTDPVAGWRAGDPTTVDRLATLELADAGLRPARTGG